MASDTIPIFLCQLCRAKLNLVGDFDPILEDGPMPNASVRHSTMLHGSVFEGPRIDDSFMLLPNDRRHPGTLPHRGLDESFVVVKHPPSDDHGIPQPSTSHSRKSQASHSDGADGFGAKMKSQANIFELASTATHVDHPLCVDCVNLLKQEINTQVQETERDIAAYSAAVAKLEAENAQPLSQEEFDRQMAEALAEEAAAREVAEQVEAELGQVEAELAALQAEEERLDDLEERYWHDLNSYHLQLGEHVEERDALLNKIDRASQRLQLLKSTNVYNDAFRIWHDGQFGTISGFRLGRTEGCEVGWDEINAAWGQAVLLLHTMAQSCNLNFSSYKLLPMGSHPRIADQQKTYDLFGPVNKFWSSSYDRAMVCFIACLKEFGEFAAAKDRQENRQPVFQFPFEIKGEKLQNVSIKLYMNKADRWTRALKFMLADLKVALQWLIKRTSDELPALQQLGPEGPCAATV